METVAIVAILALLSAPILAVISIIKISGLKKEITDLKYSHNAFKLELRTLFVTRPKADESAPEKKLAAVPAQKTTEPEPEPAPKAAYATPPPIPAMPAPAKHEPAPVQIQKPLQPIVESARAILARTWSWLLVGRENRPENVSMEYAVASTWLMRLGIVAIVACVAFFLKWSIEQGLLTEWMRVGISVLAGAAMLAGGLRLVGRKYNIIGQGLLGGGLATLYSSMYAAGVMYELVGIRTAFALMTLVTVSAGVLAVRTDSMLVAILGLIGGYCTPVALSTGVPQFVELYSYMLVLGLGILGIAHFKQWRLLNYLAFVATYGLFLASMTQYTDRWFPVAITFLSLFFVLHSWLVFFHNILKRTQSSALEIMQLVANAVIYSLTAYFLIRNAHPGPYPSIMTLSLSAFYVAHVYLFIRRRLVDRNLLIALVALAGMYATLSLPIILEKESLTICLSLLAFTFAWLGFKMRSNFIRCLSYVLYLIVFWRLLLLDVPDNFTLNRAPVIPVAEYWRLMLDRLWTFGISIASIAAAFAVHRKGIAQSESLAVSESNDTPQLVTPGAAAQAFYWFGILFVFLFAQLELYTMFGYFQPLRLPLLTILWCGMAAYFAWRYVRTRRIEMFLAMIAFLVVGVFKLLVLDLGSWEVRHNLVYHVEYSLTYVLMRLIDFGAVLLLLFGMWRVFIGRPGEKHVGATLGYCGLFVLFTYLSFELNSGLHNLLPGFQKGGITTLWALLAIAYIAGGIWKNVLPLRYIGLALFAVVVGKAFLFDLAHIEGIYRVAAFMCVGGLLLLGSFAYVYAGGKFTVTGKHE